MFDALEAAVPGISDMNLRQLAQLENHLAQLEWDWSDLIVFLAELRAFEE